MNYFLEKEIPLHIIDTSLNAYIERSTQRELLCHPTLLQFAVGGPLTSLLYCACKYIIQLDSELFEDRYLLFCNYTV